MRQRTKTQPPNSGATCWVPWGEAPPCPRIISVFDGVGVREPGEVVGGSRPEIRWPRCNENQSLSYLKNLPKNPVQRQPTLVGSNLCKPRWPEDSKNCFKKPAFLVNEMFNWDSRIIKTSRISTLLVPQEDKWQLRGKNTPKKTCSKKNNHRWSFETVKNISPAMLWWQCSV